MEDKITLMEDNRYKDIPFSTIAEVYWSKACNARETAKALGITRRTLTNWRKKFPELDEMLRDEWEGMIDFTISKLFEKIRDGDGSCIMFFLKCQAKSRGFNEGPIINANIQTDKSLSIAEAKEFITKLENEF